LHFLFHWQISRALVMWVLLWIQLVSGTFDHYHIDSYSNEEACNQGKVQAKVLVTSNNSKVVCIKIER